MLQPKLPKRRWSSAGCSVLSLALLSACGSPGLDRGPTLASIAPAPLPIEEQALPATTIDRVLQQYHAVLADSTDPEVRIKVQQRLAGLEMQRSEQQHIEADITERNFDQAIALYQALINENPGRSDNDRMLYQMAKAYDLDGRIEESSQLLGRLARKFPESEYFAEAQFRYGEMLFSKQQYQQAEQSYSAVINRAPSSPYYSKALFMRGWARFKQSRYEVALDDFVAVLDSAMAGKRTLDDLQRSQRDLAEDTLRVMSLAFSYLDGAESIAAIATPAGPGNYQHLLYLGLAELYLDKERYGDSADTLEHYVENYPLSDFAPDFSVRLIELFQQGGFPSEILPAKESFVHRYGLHSSYWSSRDEATQQHLRPYLYEYLQQLAQYYHSTAQSLQGTSSAAIASSGAANAVRQQLSRDQVQKSIYEAYIKASEWYAEFAETFPSDPKTPGMVFLMAESLTEAKQFPSAIAAYERVAYAENHDSAQGAEAGYAAILVYNRYLDELTEEARYDWQLRKIDSALRFAEVYPGDSRAAPVLTRTAEEMLQMGNAREAVLVASRVSRWQPAVAIELARTAWLVQGQGNFELHSYAGAELAYSGALALMPPDDAQRPEIVDRLAASVYQQGQANLELGFEEAAINDWLRLASIAPDSSISKTASYDAANQLMDLQEWARAEKVLTQTRARYPDHEYAASISAKLVHVHQQQGNWHEAANELSLIATTDSDNEVRRKSRFMAAELYQQAGSNKLAIDQYTEYVSEWPVPFDVAMESRYQLSLLMQQDNDSAGRQYWLWQIVQSHDAAGSAASQRSRYLAAMASSVFADESYRQYLAAPFTLPLSSSFKLKNKLMQASIAATDKVLSYGITEFVTQANYILGDIYANLSTQLMASPRPANLDALELEQYEMLLEEQAYPFEEKAIDIHESNARRSWSGIYDQWVSRSIESLSILLPARYGKTETLARYSNEIY